MGRDMYIIDYKKTEVPRNNGFFDKITDWFENTDIYTSRLYIDTERWEEWIKENPEIETQYPEQAKAIKELLKENDCIDLVIE